jgi:ribosome-binding protein aMBF1 (putative translation factor)
MVNKIPPKNLIDYAERLSWAMAQAGFDTTKLSKSLGISYQAVKKAETGKTKALTAYNNDVAANLLGVSSRWLATGQSEKESVSSSHHAAEVGSAYNNQDQTIKDAVKLLQSLPEHDRRSLLTIMRAFAISIQPSESLRVA